MSLSIIIPAYNESLSIKETIDELRNVLIHTGYYDSYEITVVDDHSSDTTYSKVESFNDDKIKCIRLSRRSGSHVAIRAGIANAKGDAVLCISADGQDDPNVLEEMLKKWRNGVNVVWALRKGRTDEPWHIKKPAKLFYQFMSCLGSHSDSRIDLSRADFYLMDKVVANAINSCPERNTSLFGLIVWLGFNQDFVEYERRARRHGKSKWNLKSRSLIAKDWIVAFSGLPLKMMSIIGIFVALIGFLYAIIVVILAFTGNPVKGWASLIIVILILGGLQMIMFGILGEYLWRNIDESRRRPLYFIEKTTFKKLEE
ncbi:MAG: glycosyltransferase [Desulfobacteraceae bacterium]|nr:glycosyltransferase [Desulfobacteraceae bacterium]